MFTDHTDIRHIHTNYGFVGYTFSKRLNFFLKGNNLANQQYNRWANFPVQGIQILGGASYKFDF